MRSVRRTLSLTEKRSLKKIDSIRLQNQIKCDPAILSGLLLKTRRRFIALSDMSRTTLGISSPVSLLECRRQNTAHTTDCIFAGSS